MKPMTPERLAKLLAAVCEENGVPNGISPGELADGRDTSPMAIGRTLRGRLNAVNRHLSARGYQVTAYENYGTGYGMRIALDAAPSTN